LKRKIIGETPGISLHCPVERLCRDAIERSQISVEQYPFAAERDPVYSPAAILVARLAA
jgi:hypothetical protein